MRIALDYTSSASASEAESSRGDDHVQAAQLRGSPASQTPTPQRRPARLSRTPSSPHLPDTTITLNLPDRRLTNLERINATRKTSTARPTSMHAKPPRWMRESTPKESVPVLKQNGDSDGEGDEKKDDVFGSDDSEEDDSEEEQWPVAPPHRQRPNFKAGRLSAAGLLRSRRQPSVEAQELSQRIRLANEADDAAALPKRTISRRIHGRHASVGLSPSPAPQQASVAVLDDEFAEVQKLLSRMRIEKEQDEKRERELFESRNKALWDNIESGIRQAEEVRAKIAREEEDRRRKAQEQRDAEELRANEARAAAEQKAKDDKAKAEQRKKEEDEKRKAQEQAAAARAVEDAKEKSMGGVGNALDAMASAEYQKWFDKMQHIKQTVLPAVSQNADWRKQCFGAKRIITRSVGQLTNSRAEIVRITQSIADVLTQARGASPDGEIHTWILNHLSKCLIRQAEQEVAAKQDTAFPLAHVVVWLLLQGHEGLSDVLMARLTKKCCWCLAYCPPKKPDQDEKTYAKVLGKSEPDEATLQYTSRMSGIMAMYFAICQTTPSQPPGDGGVQVDLQRIPPHFRPRALWSWQARMLSPRMMEHALAPALFSVLLEIAGPTMLMAYGRQTSKAWSLLRVEGLQNGKAGFTKVPSANSARVRLQLLLDDWAQSGRVEAVTTGRLMGA